MSQTWRFVLTAGVAVALSVMTMPAGIDLGAARGDDTTAPAEPNDQAGNFVVVDGTVVDPAGKPVDGATVWLITGELDDFDPPRETKTGADGRFAFPPIAENAVLRLGRRWPQVIARDGQGRIGWDSEWRGPTENRRIQLREVHDFQGRLVDAEGRPIAGASVVVKQLSATPAPRPEGKVSVDHVDFCPEVAALLGDKTAADGRFVLLGVPEQVKVTCEVNAAGFGTPQLRFDGDRAETIQLERAGRIVGKLILPGGDSPMIEGFKLVVVRQADNKKSAAEPIELGYQQELSIAADGTFHLDELPPGNYVIVTPRGQNKRFYVEKSAAFEVKPGETVNEVILALHEALELNGRVVDRLTGMGIAGVELGIASSTESNGGYAVCVTDADGRYVAYPQVGKVDVRISGDAPPDYVNPPFKNLRWHEFPDGGQWPTIELERAVQIQGLVVDEAGQAVPHALFFVVGLSAFAGDGLPRHCDALGRFVIRQLEPSRHLVLRARTATAVTDGAREIVASEAESPVKLSVSGVHAFRLRGRVVDPAGQPIPSAYVDVVWTHEVPDPFHPIRGGPITSQTLERCVVGADGMFQSYPLWSGDQYRVVAAAPGYHSEESIDMVGEAGKTRDMGPIFLHRDDVVLSGLVVDAEGHPVPDAELTVSQAPDSRATLASPRSDAAGAFSVRQVDPTLPLKLWARAKTATSNGVQVILPADLDRPIRLVADARYAFRFRGKVVDRRGLPVSGAAVAAFVEIPLARGAGQRNRRRRASRELDAARVETGPDGTFESDALFPDATYYLVVRAEGFETMEAETTLGSAGETLDVGEFILRRSNLQMEGRIVDSAGRPVEGAAVLNSGDADAPLSLATDAEGRFRLGGLYEGPVYLLVRKKGFRVTGLRTESVVERCVIVLPALDEPPSDPAPTDAPPTFDEQKQLARQLLPMLWKLRDRIEDQDRRQGFSLRGTIDHRQRLVACMARVDLAQALAWSAAEGGQYDGSAYFAAGYRSLADRANRLRGFVAAPDDWAACENMLAAASSRLDEGKAAQAVPLLEAVVARARSIAVDPAAANNNRGNGLDPNRNRIVTLSNVAVLAATAERSDWARQLIDEAAEAAEKSTDDWVRGSVAANLVIFDRNRSLQLFDAVRNSGNSYGCLVKAVTLVAECDIKFARELIGRLGSVGGGAWLRVAFGLARNRPELAIRLIDEIPDNQIPTKAEALGLVATRIAPRDPRRAQACIDDAFDLLLSSPNAFDRRPRRIGPSSGSSVMAARLALLALESGYPDMTSIVDRVLALRPTASDKQSRAAKIESLANTARLLALFDRRTARELLFQIEPDAYLIGTGGEMDGGEWLQAWALADLEHAQQLFEAELERQSQQSEIKVISSGLLPMLELLTTPPFDRADLILERFRGQFSVPGRDGVLY